MYALVFLKKVTISGFVRFLGRVRGRQQPPYLQRSTPTQHSRLVRKEKEALQAAIRQLQGTHSEPNRRSPHRSIGPSGRRNEQRSLGPSVRHLSQDYHQDSIGQSGRRNE